MSKKNWFKPIPEDLDSAVARLKENLLPEDLEYMKNNGSAAFHMGLGRHLRNEWALWQQKTVLYEYFWTYFKIWHADDMSALILDKLESELNPDKIFNLLQQTSHYHQYWLKESGVFPGTRPK